MDTNRVPGAPRKPPGANPIIERIKHPAIFIGKATLSVIDGMRHNHLNCIPLETHQDCIATLYLRVIGVRPQVSHTSTFGEIV